MMSSGMPTSPPTAEALAGEAGHDDVEEGDDAVNDGHYYGTDGMDNSHDAVADGSEKGLHARDDGTHDDGCCRTL
jgi:hypothetical protein